MKKRLYPFPPLVLVLSFAQIIQANSTKASFSTSIQKVCGLEIIKSSGSINFLDTNKIDEAQFIVRTNGKNKKTKVVFSRFTVSDNIKKENGYFLINKKKLVSWTKLSSVAIKNGQLQNVTAHINKSSSQVQAGDAKVITTLELICK